jgi:hypothetical protein
MVSLVNERRMSALWISLATVAGSAACANDDGSADDPTPTDRTEQSPLSPPAVEPPNEDPTIAALERERQLSPCDQPLDAHGIAFVDLFFAVSDYCPTRRADPNLAATTTLVMLRDDAGRNCVHGHITDGWGKLIVGFDGSNRNGAVRRHRRRAIHPRYTARGRSHARNRLRRRRGLLSGAL